MKRPGRAVRAIVSLGSNVEPRAEHLARALEALSAFPKTRLVAASSVTETEPVDVPARFADRKFLNQVAVFSTGLSADDFSWRMHAVEDELGRVRTVRNGPRTADIDLVDFGGLVRNGPELTLPHPRAMEREFVLAPLRELGIAPVVILAAGDFPKRGSAARRILEGALTVVCCDSAADAYRAKVGREPSVALGDGDSVRGPFDAFVKVEEQDTNDLAKAIRLCAERGWRDPIALGVTGKREDHTLGNVFRAMEAGVTVVTDYGIFRPLEAGPNAFDVIPGAAVSVFATDKRTRMSSDGLAWPLAGVTFENLYCATLNRATGLKVAIRSNRPAFVYIAS